MMNRTIEDRSNWSSADCIDRTLDDALAELGDRILHERTAIRMHESLGMERGKLSNRRERLSGMEMSLEAVKRKRKAITAGSQPSGPEQTETGVKYPLPSDFLSHAWDGIRDAVRPKILTEELAARYHGDFCGNKEEMRRHEQRLRGMEAGMAAMLEAVERARVRMEKQEMLDGSLHRSFERFGCVLDGSDVMDELYEDESEYDMR